MEPNAAANQNHGATPQKPAITVRHVTDLLASVIDILLVSEVDILLIFFLEIKYAGRV